MKTDRSIALKLFNPLLLGFTVDALGGDGTGEKPFFRDGTGAIFADPECAVVYAPDCFLHLGNQFSLY